MRRRWVPALLLAAGATMLAGARLATASPPHGGVLRIGETGSSWPIDPQLQWFGSAIEYATAETLYNYPDKRPPVGSLLVPEVASSFTVSRDGKTYTFRIRKGFRFSDGSPVTARNYAYAIDRVLNLELGSPRAQLITDSSGANIVGAADVYEGRAKHASGVVAKGRKLIIRLTRPDGAFLPKIALPAFQATSTKLPLSEQVLGPYPTAGPYAFKRLDVNVQTSIRRNPYYTFGPGRHRPRNLAGVDVFWRIDEQTGFEQVKGGELDLGPLPAPEVQGVAEQYGVNKTRFWSEPQNCTGYLPMNMANDLFRNNLPLRRAVNYAIDRKAYVAQSGPYAGKPWTHLLNPGVPGWRNVTLYKHNLAKAKRLAAGHLRDGKITVYFHPFSAANRAQAQIVRQDLINIGFQPENITMKSDYHEIYDPLGVRGTDADIAVSRGWCSDYPDPYAFINVLFDGNLIRAENNVNWSYMDMPTWNRKMEAAARLVGPRRYRAYGQLDIDLMRQVAPVAVERTYNARYFFSDRVDPKSLVYQGIYGDWSIPALRLK